MAGDITHSWELVKAILEENYATRRKLDYYACKMFSARQGKIESIASWGNQIDELQTELREAARRVCKGEDILGAIGLINHLRKACFIQGLSNERMQTIVRTRGESILLSQAIELSLEEERAILLAKEILPSTANGPLLRCSRCHRLGHTANKCIDLNKFSPTSVKTVLSCFNCGRKRHVAWNCRQRPTYKGSVGRDTDNTFGSVGRDTQYKDSVGRDNRCKDGVGTDTNNSCRTLGNGCIRLENHRRAVSSNPTTARRKK